MRKTSDVGHRKNVCPACNYCFEFKASCPLNPRPISELETLKQFQHYLRSGADPGFIIGGKGEVPPGGTPRGGPPPPPLDPRLRALTTYITPHDKLIDLFLPRPDCTQHSTTMKLLRTVYAVLLLLWISFSQTLSSLCCWTPFSSPVFSHTSNAHCSCLLSSRDLFP